MVGSEPNLPHCSLMTSPGNDIVYLPNRTCIFFIRRSRFRSTVFRQTKVYLLALDSIFVPSMYSTFRLMKPLEEKNYGLRKHLVDFLSPGCGNG